MLLDIKYFPVAVAPRYTKLQMVRVWIV